MIKRPSNLVRKIDLLPSKNEPIFFMGISSSKGTAVMASQLNLYLDISLEFHSQLVSKSQGIVLEQFLVFKNFKPEKLEREELDLEINLMDFILEEETALMKIVLIQNKGLKSQVIPKITQLDYLVLSNYALEHQYEIIKSMPDTSFCFPLEKKNIGTKLKYCQELLSS